MAENALVFDFLARDRASKTFDKLAGKSDSLGKKLAGFGKVAAVGLAAAGAGAVALGPKVLAAAGRLEQMGAKAETVFGGQLGRVEKWSKANAAAMGLTSRGLTGLAANFGDLLVPMGFTREQAAKMSTDVVGLSGALSQWSGGTRSAAEVADILSKAMLGERDALKGLGISITDADVKSRLAAKGQEKLTGAALEQAKAVATQELIFAKSKDAQAAYRDGSDKLIAKVDKVKAKFREYGETLLVKATPALSGLVDFTTGKALPALEGFATVVSTKVIPKIVEKFGSIKGAVEKALPDIDLSGLATTFAGQAKGWAKAIIGGVRTGLDTGDWSGLGKSLGTGLGKALDKIGAVAGTLAKKFASWFGKVDWIGLGISAGKQAIPFLVGFVVGILNVDILKLLKGLAAHWQEALFAVIAIAFAPVKFIGAVGKALAKIPFVGRMLEWALLHFKSFADGLVRMAGKAIAFLGRAFMDGFRRVFPGVGHGFGKALALLPLRLALVALELQSKALKMMLGLARAIGKGIAWVVGQIGEVIARMLRPFTRAGSWLVGKGQAVIQGLLDGLKARWKRVTDWVSGIGRWIKDHKGPLSLDAKLLVPAGLAIMGGFYRGLKSGAGPAMDFVRKVGGNVSAILGGSGFGAAPSGGNRSNQALGQIMARAYGWTGGQWEALRRLWMGESGWNHLAQNPTSTAFGIAQFLNSTWSSVGASKTSDPGGQIAAGLRYIAQRYGSPMAALSAWSSRSPHWYGSGGWITEPVVGVGMRSGAPYGFGERGPELVTPAGRVGGGTTVVNLSITLPPGSDAEQGRRIVGYIQEYERRSGKRWRTP